MDNLDNRLKAAFDSVHAEENLKTSVRNCVLQQAEKSSGGFRPLAVLTCMLLVFFSGYFCRMLLEPVSIISIDINPSIELGINTFDQVVSVEAFNEDGRILADQLQLRFLNYEEAVERIVNSETVSSLLNQKEELTFTVVGEDESRSGRLCTNLESYTASGNGMHCHSVSLQEVAPAHGCGMSYGKYLACQQALQQDADLTVEETQDMTMKEIREVTEETTQPQQHEPKHHNHGYKHKNGHH